MGRTVDIPLQCGATLALLAASVVTFPTLRVSGPETELRKEPKQRRSQILVDAVADAATRVLPKFGVSGATTNRIADVAGVSIGSLYQYFPSKESIFARAIERDLRKREDEFEAVLSSVQGGSLEDVIGALTRKAVDTFFDDAPALRLLFAQVPSLDRIDAIVEHRERVAELFGRALQQAADTDATVPGHDEMLFAIHAVMGTIQAALMAESLPEREPFSRKLRDLVLGFARERGHV